MQHPRWKRLSAGFRHEEALLLLYVAAEHLNGLAAEPDGVVVLAPQGLDLAVADAPALTEAIGGGMTLIAVVAETAPTATVGAPLVGALDTPTQPPEPVAAEPATPIFKRPSAPMMSTMIETHPGFAWGTWMTIVLLVAAIAGASWWLISRRQAAVAAIPGADSAAQVTAPIQPPPPPPAESLPFAVQVASVPRLADAFALADSLSVRSLPAIVAPVSLRGRGAVFRVLAGPY